VNRAPVSGPLSATQLLPRVLDLVIELKPHVPGHIGSSRNQAGFFSPGVPDYAASNSPPEVARALIDALKSDGPSTVVCAPGLAV
jgi:hypothetical protein